MGKIESFNEIEAWQMARKLTSAIYTASRDNAFSRDFALRDQMRRAAISIMSNIAEGFNRGGNRELIQFLFIAKGSTAEVQSQLFIALDAGYLSQEKFDELNELSDHISRLISAFIRYLKTQNFQIKHSSNLNTHNAKRTTHND